MKISNLLGERLRETPSECTTANHTFLVRGGYIKQVGSGIYSLFMPGKRVCRKIENIIREEMDLIGGQEVQFPVVMPASLWEESGRYYSIGSEMARFSDRTNTKMVLGMTHEEAAVHLAKDVANSHIDYPFMIYQIQTKFRDEPRSRGGLIRVREFTMKDAYSFHTSQECLDAYYEKCLRSYHRIYARVGMPDIIAVKSDSGMMGGSVAHEFMFLSDIGEDSIAICQSCGYSSNVEAAECMVPTLQDTDAALSKVETPGCKTIEALTELLNVEASSTCKAVVYQRNSDDRPVIVFIRGDREINETKLRNVLGYDIHVANAIPQESGIVAGYIGPIGLSVDAAVVYDRTLAGRSNLVCGANEEGCHYTGMSMSRDLPNDIQFCDVAKSADGDICPVCGKRTISVQRGVEAGNIFKLGTKYSESMHMTYQDRDGTQKTPIMGCYGIGVGRLVGCICEKYHDKYGPIWPITVAPWEVQICALGISKNPSVQTIADKLYSELWHNNVEVLLDDRNIGTGAMFADADLLGCPIRIIVSPRNCENGVVELTLRDKSIKEEVAYSENDLSAVVNRIKQLIANEYAKINLQVDAV